MAGTLIPNSSPTIIKNTNGDKCVRVCLSTDQVPLPVDTSGGAMGVSLNVFNEITGVAQSAESDVVSYTVPALKKATILYIDASGDSTAIYRVKLNGTTIAKKRSYPGGGANVQFDFDRYCVNAGDEIKVTAENCNLSADAGEFEARINGMLGDV